MSLPKLIATALALLLFRFGFSQAICGFDEVHGKKMKENPVYRQNILNYESNLRQYIQQHPELQDSKIKSNSAGSKFKSLGGGPPYLIPLVVHVVHTGGALGSIYNPTDAQVQSTVDYVNQVYNGTYPGTVGAGDLQIQFVLAKRDPNCNPTNGIDHVDGSGIAGYTAGGVNLQTTLGTDELNVKNLVRWDPSQYYNVWVVDKIDGNDGTSGSFFAGFAYFPGSPSNYDGTILLATQMGPGLKTLPHELGHGFNLYHPFQDASGAVCPPNADCTVDGDQVCDTDPITQPVGFVCRSGNNPCTSTAYTNNTESNYMNYTNCSTLFTVGQKTRMLASAASPARISLANSLGGTAPGAGSTPCIPKIDFEITNDQVTEATAASSVCRSYTDYTYNVVIGNGPSVNATATLYVAGSTATEGLDFDITTNGNFASPSKTLNFPAGSTSSQSFNIRIYDDASVEGTEDFTLGFTVNNGGGDAVLGDGRPNLTITINDNDTAPYGPVNVTKSLGSNVGLLSSPFAAASTKQKSQIMYLASELKAAGIAAGNIVGLALNISKNSGSSFVYNSLTIKMGQTNHGSLYNGSTEGPLSDAGFTTVYSSNFTTADGWNNFVFSAPFTWDGSSNIVVEICYDDGASTSSNDNIEAYSDGNPYSRYGWQSGINCTGSFSGFNFYNSGFKPIIQFVYADPGTQIQTVINSSKQEYLGPNADIYYYDQATNKLMARIQNLGSFNYGCTQVILDRQGSGATAFWNNNTANFLMDKTFHVLPTTNNPAGSYTVTLYYTQAEVNGWQAATGQSISNIQLVKVTNQISNVTPVTSGAGGTVTIGSPIVSSLASNTALSFNFTNGFSGFGAGVVGTALPITLLDFEGRLIGKNIRLDWSTSLEVNSKAFEVERSYSDSGFVKIGAVAATGNSSENRSYSFIDPDPAQENNFYRLKQIDLDGKFQYSRIVIVKGQNGENGFKILNNPFTDNLAIQFDKAPAGRVGVRLLDVTGRELYQQQKESSGLNRIPVDLSGTKLSAGIYLLELRYNNEIHVERVIKE